MTVSVGINGFGRPGQRLNPLTPLGLFVDSPAAAVSTLVLQWYGKRDSWQDVQKQNSVFSLSRRVLLERSRAEASYGRPIHVQE